MRVVAGTLERRMSGPLLAALAVLARASPEGAAPRGGGGGDGGSVLAACWARVPDEALRLAKNGVWATAVLGRARWGWAPPPTPSRRPSTTAPTPPPRAAGRW